jgi:EAL domain-containing protein (putative c-di-GMP-specific phosphodiesterase class I)
VAEGVEEEEQLKWLRRSKCDYVQGFYVGRPQAPERVLSRFKV